mmetsp:Transcript_32192/g.64178  ORF Transcript_32192/g.64178 Transcript_32192/m.64178 type:complete len:422 (+) Transcript_32192:399-1664(+)
MKMAAAAKKVMRKVRAWWSFTSFSTSCCFSSAVIAFFFSFFFPSAPPGFLFSPPTPSPPPPPPPPPPLCAYTLDLSASLATRVRGAAAAATRDLRWKRASARPPPVGAVARSPKSGSVSPLAALDTTASTINSTSSGRLNRLPFEFLFLFADQDQGQDRTPVEAAAAANASAFEPPEAVAAAAASPAVAGWEVGTWRTPRASRSWCVPMDSINGRTSARSLKACSLFALSKACAMDSSVISQPAASCWVWSPCSIRRTAGSSKSMPRSLASFRMSSVGAPKSTCANVDPTNGSLSPPSLMSPERVSDVGFPQKEEEGEGAFVSEVERGTAANEVGNEVVVEEEEGARGLGARSTGFKNPGDTPEDFFFVAGGAPLGFFLLPPRSSPPSSLPPPPPTNPLNPPTSASPPSQPTSSACSRSSS